MNGFLESLEQTSISLFIRESSSYFAFPGVLSMHTLGLCFLLGANTIVSMRCLGMISTIPLKPLRKLFPFMWLGLLLTIISGIGLTISHATTRALNPILLVKLAIIAIGSPIMWKFQKKILDDPSVSEDELVKRTKTIAASQIILWFIVLVAGRLIAYSATILGDGY
jgi:hypothetical protein